MSARPDLYDKALDRAAAHARDWLADVPGRDVPPQPTPTTSSPRSAGRCRRGRPTRPTSSTCWPAHVEPALMAMPSGRFFGWVIGGTLPAALAADWLVSAWDQNTGMRFATPGTAATEEVAAAWLLDLLGLPARPTSASSPAARWPTSPGSPPAGSTVLTQAGWDLDRDGLTGAPRVTCWSARTGTPPSTWPCATSASARRPRSPPTSRAGSGRPRCRRPSTGRRADDRRAAGRQPALRRVRPVRRVHRAGARARRLGARRRRLRAVGGGVADAAAPGRRRRAGRLVGHRRAQDPEHAVRLRHRRWCATRLPLRARLRRSRPAT